MAETPFLQDVDGCMDAVEAEESGQFSALIARARLDPREQLRYGDFSHCAFDGDDMRGFDFSGCNLLNTTFAGARIDAAVFDLANVSLAALRAAADFDAWLKADLARPAEARRRIAAARLPDLATFREAPWAPEMVVIPAGEFAMGSDESDDEAYDDEKRKRRMRIPERFAFGKYPVTFEEYDLFAQATRRGRAKDWDWGRERRPVIGVTWDDARAYADWLGARLGARVYALPREAQFEYAARAGTTTRRWWGDGWDPAKANGARKFEGGRTSPVDRFPANPWGLHDTIGNVWQWCADEWADKLSDLPADGSPQLRETGKRNKSHKNNDNSPERVLRGGSWDDVSRNLRSAVRYRDVPDDRYSNVGFRLSRTL